MSSLWQTKVADEKTWKHDKLATGIGCVVVTGCVVAGWAFAFPEKSGINKWADKFLKHNIENVENGQSR